MATYAALVSLINILDQIRNHPRLSDSLDNKQVEFLSDNLAFLLDFIESGSSHGGTHVLEGEIASAAHAAEDAIESHVVDQIRAKSVSLLDLQTVIQGMDSVKEKVVKVKEEGIKLGFEDDQPRPPTYPTSSATTTASSTPLITTGAEKSMMVGFEDELTKLVGALTGDQPRLQIIPILGMGGIGKTTLARNGYEDARTLHRFDFRAWATISHEYSVTEIFSKLLSSQSSKSGGESGQETEHQLIHELYKKIKGRRYLIILDDMWTIETWNEIQRFFPDDNNGSRIVLTTRQSDLALHFRSSCCEMSLLDEDQSWELFCVKAFAREAGCPGGLEQIGKKIVKKCKGLPLSIVVIAGFLGRSEMTQEYWTYVAEDENYVRNLGGDDARSLDILSLSYSHLPAHLKPCFLHTGIFPEDHEIRVSRLVKLWVGEGFIKPDKTRSLEEVAEGYLVDLISRNLIVLGTVGSTGKFKTCHVHDLLRDLCLKTAKKEKFLRVLGVPDIPRGVDNERRVVFHERIPEEKIDHDLKPESFVRSLVSRGGRVPFKSRLLRVLDVDDSERDLDYHLKQLNLRSLFYKPCLPASGNYSRLELLNPYKLPSSISLVWNLQTLIITDCGEVVAPSKIWEMRQLRHLELPKLRLPEPPWSYQQDEIVLENLQTLKGVINFKWSEEACKRIPNVKKLKTNYLNLLDPTSGLSHYSLGSLRKLESLNCCHYDHQNRGDFLHKLTFPSSLRKLTLEGQVLCWWKLKAIGSLRRLEVLKLKKFWVRGRQWSPVEGEFLNLKFLGIYFCHDLETWNAERCHFPRLEKLVLEGLDSLEKIPLEIGKIPTLGLISLENCSESAAISALEILEEQEIVLGNEGLRVRIMFRNQEQLKRVKMREEFDKFTSKYLQLDASRW